jgi:hypothetical protein
MSTSTPGTLQGLLDREAIRDCLYRYCRGIDRLDEESLRSAYWPDATDRHGAYDGSAAAVEPLRNLQAAGRIVHLLGNIMIELRGDVAARKLLHRFPENAAGDGARETLLSGLRRPPRKARRGMAHRRAHGGRPTGCAHYTAVRLGAKLRRAPADGRALANDPIYELLAALR